MSKRAWLGLLCLTALGCNGSDSNSGVTTGTVTVLVTDDGFDLSVPALKGKVAAAYTVDCPPPPDAAAGGAGGGSTGPDGGASFADDKAEFIGELSQPPDDCNLRTGIDPLVNPFADLDAHRTALNAEVAANQAANEDPVFQEIYDRLDSVEFHGTATSSVIAYDNPAVRLVLVQLALGAPGAPIDVGCMTQADFDEATKVLSDPDVLAAAARQPLSRLEMQLAQMAAEQHVELSNESFGYPARQELEAAVFDSCQKAGRSQSDSTVSLRGFFAASNKLQRLAEARLPQDGRFTVQSAGNDGDQIDSTGDSLDCQPDNAHLVLIGSYGVTGQPSVFTNHGQCVAANAPGEFVVTTLPGDWHMPLSGTSFAAPLVVRLLSLGLPAGAFDATAAHAALLSQRDGTGAIPQAKFPKALLWRPVGLSSVALRLGGGRPNGPRLVPLPRRKFPWPLASSLGHRSWSVRR